MKYKKFAPDGTILLYDSGKLINYYRRIIVKNNKTYTDFVRAKHTEYFFNGIVISTFDMCNFKTIYYNCNFDIVKEDEI